MTKAIGSFEGLDMFMVLIVVRVVFFAKMI